ncbi:hypothetical protein QP568_09765 [Propionimicrobium lymphophilum]|uniref:Uncharacterized protein n=1 Tax=Propionimicrobium lymphophilum ACS-093-V-SCH5 TaxID=883161 RepID=S2WYV1_9ACTN|nr:hypothetical protein [Propionimicrobium lymphophilum]EPD32924.1 hypothetical protein HMPREF9306_01232 [Propionimicrobium lymphophilum ACS-093-V-SCH5]MDK7710639.1 hypothetical protein [Propionimicrobium lymphophilum]MDK7734569.1 hypothetical protein [Propionimicrobium lymphophilum]
MSYVFTDDTAELLASRPLVVNMDRLEEISQITVTMIALSSKARVYRTRVIQALVWAIADGEHPKLAADAAGMGVDDILPAAARAHVEVPASVREAVMRASLAS